MSRSAHDPQLGMPAVFVGFPRQEWGRRRSHHWILVLLCAVAGVLSLAAGVLITYRVHALELILVPDGSASRAHSDRALSDDAVVIDFVTTLVARAESWSPASITTIATQTRAAIHPSARLAWAQTFAQHEREIGRIPTAQMAEPFANTTVKRTATNAITVAVAYHLHQFLVIRDPPGWMYVRTQTWVMTVEVVAIAPDEDCPSGLLALLPSRQSEDDYVHDGGSRFWSAPP